MNATDLSLASEQQKQLSYFTESDLQESFVSDSFYEEWANRKFQTGDYFINWIKTIFKTDNFLMYFKYIRKPLPSSKLVKTNVEPNLKKVLFAENSYYEYNVTGVDQDNIQEVIKPTRFNDEMFYRLIYRSNDLIIEDASESGAYRYYVNIEKVKSLDYDEEQDEIKRVGFTGVVNIEGEDIQGYIYIDKSVYQFYDYDDNLLKEVFHDLEKCPASFVSNKKFKDSNIIRESIFTFIRSELEDYAFLSVLRKMMYPNGAFPIITKILTEDNDNDTNQDPNIKQFGGQEPSINSENTPIKGGVMQAGSVIELEATELTDGSYDTKLIQEYMKFHYIPVDVIQNIDQRIKDIETDIVTSLVGDNVSDSNQEAKNKDQVKKGVSALENNLLTISSEFSRIRTISDTNLLKIQFGSRFKSMMAFYGTDWYMDSVPQLREELKTSTNPIETKDILLRINSNKYKNNPAKGARQKLLYSILPFISDSDFDKAVEGNIVDEVTKVYQLRFNYWIGVFEATYGDINVFYNELEGEDSTKLVLINNLILQIINKTHTSNTKQEE